MTSYGDGLFGVFEEEPDCNTVGIRSDCNTVGISVNCNTVGTDPTSLYPYIPSRDSVVRTPAFWERERSLIDGEINSFDWEQEYSGKGRELPPPVRLAYILILYPSLRELEGAELAGVVIDPAVSWGEDENERFAVAFDKLREADKLPDFTGEAMSDLVKAALETELLPVNTDQKARQFIRAVNALYHWQAIQGNQEIAVPCRMLGRTLGHGTDKQGRYIGDYASDLLRKAVKERFLELVSKGDAKAGPRSPSSRYRFIGRLVNGVIEPA